MSDSRPNAVVSVAYSRVSNTERSVSRSCVDKPFGGAAAST